MVTPGNGVISRAQSWFLLRAHYTPNSSISTCTAKPLHSLHVYYLLTEGAQEWLHKEVD